MTNTPFENEESSRLAPLTRRLQSLAAQHAQQHESEIAQLLRSNGLAYGSVGQRRLEERPWQLDVLPKLIEQSEWQQLEAGLNQRARLKQALLNDIYGEQALFHQGIMPAQAVFAHRGYLRAVRQVPSAWQLPLCNIDVTRTRHGTWLATGDSNQKPGHVGYALENRLVLSQVLPDHYRYGRVQRHAAYFRSLIATLSNSMDIDERCVLLGYGASHPNHFEHAYLAKYLGYTLVEPNDLTVRDQRVWLKTVAGLQRVDVIFRFINDRDTDPLAYSGGDGTGIPGLLHAAIANNVQIINPLGSAALDNPALDAYLAPLCQFYLGETPLLDSVGSYWLGDAAQRDAAFSRLDALSIRDINAAPDDSPVSALNEQQRSALLTRIDATPHSFVAVEPIDRERVESVFNQMPTSLPIILRTYLVNNGENFEAMPGGLCLLDDNNPGDDQQHQSSKDVWVLSRQNVPEDSLLPHQDIPDYAIHDGELPSRVADNLFWLGRNAERAENTLRNLRSALQLMRRFDADEQIPVPTSELLASQLRATTTATDTLPGFVGAGAARRLQKPDRELLSIIFNENRTGSLANTLQNLQFTAGSVRDRVSYDLLRILNRLDDRARFLQQESAYKSLTGNSKALSQLIEQFNQLIDSLAALSGMTHENFTHGEGWQFMMLGRRIERARQATAVLGSVLQNNQNDPAVLENLLRNFDSVMTYRSRYRSQLDARLVLNLLLLDERNPRSVAYQLLHIDRSIRTLPGMRRADHSDPLLKLVTAVLSRVRLAEPAELLAGNQNQRQSLKKFVMIIEELTSKLATTLSANYLTHTEIPTNLDTASLLTAILVENTDPADNAASEPRP